MREVTIYTDGSCSKNPGPGGWAAVLIYNGREKEIFGGEKETTNNRMEMTAVIEALSSLKEPCRVQLFSDSKYVVDSINKKWVYSWEKKNWKKSDGSKALNIDLWQKLLPLLKIHDVCFNWVKGHDNNKYNEICDKLAVQETKKFL